MPCAYNKIYLIWISYPHRGCIIVTTDYLDKSHPCSVRSTAGAVERDNYLVTTLLRRNQYRGCIIVKLQESFPVSSAACTTACQQRQIWHWQ
jgi:hypothetical protein